MFRVLTIFLFMCNGVLASETFNGKWQGELYINKQLTLPLVFHLNTLSDTPSASIDSPQQRAYGIPVSRVEIKGNTIFLDMAAIGATFDGTLEQTSLKGTFSQMGREFNLEMSRLNDNQLHEYTISQRRPQEPVAPFPYLVEEVIFDHPTESFRLAGTLTRPKGKGVYPAVLLISGSGPQDRDETLFGHKPFMVIADHLTKQGYAVLRVDDRGVGQSQGVYGDTTLEEFTTDIAAGMHYLVSRSDIAESAIGLAGHSEGAMTGAMYIAQQVQRAKLPPAAFLIMLAGVGVTGKQLWLDQQFAAVEYLPHAMRNKVHKALADAVKMAEQGRKAEKIERYLIEKDVGKEQAVLNARYLSSRWGRSFLSYDPHAIVTHISVPVLVLHGSLDKQVDAARNLQGLKIAFERANNPQVTFKQIQGVNHLLQPAKTGMPDEYARIDETVSLHVLSNLSKWLNAQQNTSIENETKYSE
ncbi:alpha/beta hydrolase family protein [Alteromonas sp. ASW11-130]|uniref:alpha/beta hydrolase family protein n=1 Tax=Alteromonas sp. ASW11-130 TaxID=3015775 RepID=UPI002242BA0D|nr:alpha/beta fold hydrolase [Alteromonas sp. ASW11-130]MCW8092746.1 alpha/beta hydrolase [Alteromonas sp. ASW11-130]